MAVDFSVLRNKLTQLKNKAQRGKKIMWKPKSGDNIIRIVPLSNNPKDPFTELFVYYGLNGKNFLSPSSFGNADPIVEFVEKIKTSGTKDEYKEARKVLPKIRIFLPVLVRGQENEGVKFWGFGRQVYEQLLTYLTDPDYGDITDLKSGRDVVVTHTPGSGQDYGSTTTRVKPAQTPATTDPEVLGSIKEGSNSQTLIDYFTQPTYEQLVIELNQYLTGGTEEETEPSENYEQPAAKQAAAPVTDIDETLNQPSGTKAKAKKSEGVKKFKAMLQDEE